VLGILMGGWASANKFSLIGGLRAGGQLIAYELPLILAAITVAVQAGRCRWSGIVEAQATFMIPGTDINVWFVFPQIVGFAIFFIAAMAELSRPPFDMPIADSELVFGYMTEYTGIKFAMYMLAEYAGMIAMSALIVVLFLGGWQPLPGVPLPGCEGTGGPVRLRPRGARCSASGDARQDHGAGVPDGVAAGRLPAAARGPAPALLVARARPGRAAQPRRRHGRQGGVLMATTSPPGVGLLKGLGVTIKHLARARDADVPQAAAGPAAAHPRRHRADGRELHGVHAVRARVPRLVHLHRLAQGDGAAGQGGRRARTRNVLDRFAIDFSLCMYCGICVEVCPFDALWWSPEFEYAEYSIDGLLHEMGKLREWMDTVPPPPGSTTAPCRRRGRRGDREGRAGAPRRCSPAERPEAKAAERRPVPRRCRKPRGRPAQGRHPRRGWRDRSGDLRPADRRGQVRADGPGEGEGGVGAQGEAADHRRAGAGGGDARRRAGDDADAGDGRRRPSAGEPPQAAPKKADIHVEGGEIDQETYDQLIAEGKSERMARAKAKAAWVRKEKQRIIDEGGDA
jgi:ferredoxin